MIVRRTTSVFVLSAIVVLAAVGIVGSSPTAPGFGDPLRGLTASEIARFEVGLAQFVGPEHVLPDGLGPVFNAPLVNGEDVASVACSTCHTTPAIGGGNSTQLETRFGRITNGVFDPLTELGGSLLQSQGIGNGDWGFNFQGEAMPPQANVVARRRTTPLFGAGLVEAVTDEFLIKLAEREQLESPGKAGRPSVVVEPSSDQERVGRFGWKAQHAVLFAFAGEAYLNESGPVQA
jgi:hypothetical protein